MKKLITLLILINSLLIHAQEITNKSLVGIWKVFDLEIDSKAYINFDDNLLDEITSFYQSTEFIFSKNGFVKLKSKEKVPNILNNKTFNNVFYFNTDNNIISIGNRKKSSNVLYIQAKQVNDLFYFNFIGVLLKVKKTENSEKLKINKNIINSSKSLIGNKPLIYEDISDEESNMENIDEFIKTYNCSHLIENISIKKCVAETITHFFQRKFNIDIAANLGLSGRLDNKISFIINKEGNIVNIKVESQNPILSDEIVKTINLLPKFIPAKKNSVKINTKYSFPVIFQIQD